MTAAVSFVACGPPSYPEGVGEMSFFITSARTGQGANFGGLSGADAHCRELATAASSGKKDWRAYLSAEATADSVAVHAKDRIGRGPWFNAKGVQVADSVEHLHSDDNRLGATTSLDEQGRAIGRDIHDILTGSNPDGTVATGATCGNWSTGAGAMAGHHDRRGGGDRPRSWNSAHMTEGCTLTALRGTGGDGRFYCFAAD
jgi:hypothetical protein